MLDVDNIMMGAALLFTPMNMLLVTFGLVAGFVVGVLPGFGGANAAAIALPLTIGMPVEGALILMISIYAGAQYGGAIPAILLNVPGEAGSAATALDGYPLAQQGKAELAIGLARMASAVGGVFAISIVLLIIEPMSRFAQSFGLRELFVLTLMGLTLVGGVLGQDFKKGLISAVLGVLIAMMASSPITAHGRMTFGFPELYESIPFIPAFIGLFGYTQMFILARQTSFIAPGTVIAPRESRHGWRAAFADSWDGVRTTLSYPGHLLRGGALGTFLGILPGVGAAIANFTSYGIAQKLSKTPERFGKGAPEGVIASEVADNACASGTLVPTLTFGLPGSGTAAIMLAALWLHGIRPGPDLMSSHTAEVYSVLLAMLLASCLILPLGIVLATPLAQITRAKPRFIVVFTMVLATIGAFGYRGSMFDVLLAFVFGIIGYILRARNYPIVPLVLALVLGPLAEQSLIRALSIGRFDPLYMFSSGMAQIPWALFAAMIIYFVVSSSLARSKRNGATAAGMDAGASLIDVRNFQTEQSQQERKS